MKITFDILCVCAIIFLIIIAVFSKLFNTKGTYNSISENINLLKNNIKYKQNNNFQSRGEKVSCEILEEIFNTKFEKQRPNFLINPIGTGHNLELDCYNSKLKIGLEYNGKQHYEYTPFFHKNYETFENQKYRDLIKKQLCEKNNIFLITIPYNIPHNKIKDEILKQLRNRKK